MYKLQLKNILLALILVFLYQSSVALGQVSPTTALMKGTITDQQGGVIVGASIIATNLSTNLVRETTVNETGEYLLTQLPPGNYEIKISADGFANQTIKNFSLELGTEVNLNLQLKLGSASDIVEVSASELANTNNIESGTNVGSDRIDGLPINRRDFLDFTLTSPRVVRDRTPSVGVIAGTGLSFNGQPGRFNNVTIDGLDNNESVTGAVRATFSQEAVQEFQVVSDSYSAEFGRALGGIVNIVTKGGGNDFHGSLFFLTRNDKISARDVFAPTESRYRQYQFGATLSGAIKKDKAFFFGSFERLSIKQSKLVTISDDSVHAAANQGFIFGNGSVPVAVNNSTGLVRLDANISPNDLLFVRYNFSGSFDGALEPFGGLVAETNGGTQILTDSSLAINNTYINNTLNFINETRFLYGRRDQNLFADNNGPRVQVLAPEGLIIFGRPALLPQPRVESFYHIINNVTLPRDKHRIKFGADFIFTNPNADKTKVPLFGGGFAFFQPLNFADLTGLPGAPTLTALQALDPSLRTPAQKAFLTFLSAALPGQVSGFPSGLKLAELGLPLAYAQGFGDPRVNIGQKQFGTFVQDDFSVNSKLLIKAGLRYDLSRTKSAPDNSGNFSPRVAVAYRPSNKLYLRAAYGLFFGTPLFGLSTLVQLTTIKQSVKVPVLIFPFSVLPFALPGHKFPEGNMLPAGVNFTPQLSTAFSYDPNLRNSYSQQLITGFDYSLSNNTKVSLNYSYVRGIKIVSTRNINPIVRPTNDPIASQLQGRVNTSQGDIFEFESAFDSYYNGVTVSVNQNIKNKLTLLAHYTFSKAIDNFIDISSNQQETVDSLNIGQERALSLQDVRNRFVLSGIFNLDAISSRWLHNFQLSTILNLESGKPYNLLAGLDLNGNGDSPAGDRPIVNGVSLPRNAGITPGFASLDLRLSRNFLIKESYHLQFLAEGFNLFNHTNISELDRVFTPNDQKQFNLPPQENGRYVALPSRFRNAFSPRQFQLGFKVTF